MRQLLGPVKGKDSATSLGLALEHDTPSVPFRQALETRHRPARRGTRRGTRRRRLHGPAGQPRPDRASAGAGEEQRRRAGRV